MYTFYSGKMLRVLNLRVIFDSIWIQLVLLSSAGSKSEEAMVQLLNYQLETPQKKVKRHTLLTLVPLSIYCIPIRVDCKQNK